MADPIKIGEELNKIVGRAHIKTGVDAVAPYTVDDITPTAVVFPKDTDQVSEVVTYAARRHLAILPWGSGTKMASGFPPKRLDVVVCTSRLNRMTDIDTDNLTMTVEAGVKFRDMQARLATQDDRCYLPLDDLETEANDVICSDRSYSGCFIPLDPPFSAKATIGGILASNSSGPKRLLYGQPRDVALGVRFVAPGGEIVGSGGKTVKNVSGYDISKLMIGSSGSLGIICEATLRLLPLPECLETVLVSFDSFKEMGAFVDHLFQTQLLPAAVEVMNRRAFEAIEKERYGFGPGTYVAALGLEGFDEAVDRMRKEILKMVKSLETGDKAILEEDDHRLFWLARGDLQAAVSDRFHKIIRVKLNYQISDWKQIIQFTTDTLSSNQIEYTLSCQAGSGVCVVNLLVDENDPVMSDKAISAIGLLLECTDKANGNLVVETAPAEMKKDLPLWGNRGQDFPVMARIKKEVDPSGVMSPGRFVGGL